MMLVIGSSTHFLITSKFKYCCKSLKSEEAEGENLFTFIAREDSPKEERLVNH